MSEAPKQIWVWWDDEYDVGVVSKHGDKRYIPDEAREFVRADRIEELEATISQAAKFIEFLDENYSHVFGNTAREKIRALYAELKENNHA